MPRRTDIDSILILGSGPIVIGQACEFDYSGTQAVRALKEEGYRVVLVNSNPATIMTDPDLADRTYIEPLTPEWVERVIEREKPDALLPTMGGQTALNIAMDLHRLGVLAAHGVELIGADERSIKMAEDREEFTAAMNRIGLAVPHGGFARSLDDALEIIEETGYPAIIRPSFTLGGTGGGTAYNLAEFEAQVRRGLDASPISEVLIDRSVIGWKEYELEVVRDGLDNVIIVCSIENFDAMGVHTGDSITVAPAQTLSDAEYQRMRDDAIAIIREIGVEAGGCNIQFAVNPENGEMLVVEMNPRVSRSSALASKATGFPIARVGAKLAVGYHLYELPNDITKTTPASFEPALDYVVVKFPRFAFEKFPDVDDTLGVQMKAVGETMAIGRTFRSAWQKGLRGMEVGRIGWVTGKTLEDDGLDSDDPEALLAAVRRPTTLRKYQLKRALEAGISIERLYRATGIDPWFLDQLVQILEMERWFRDLPSLDAASVRRMKREGFADAQLAALRGVDEAAIRSRRWKWGIRPTYNVVDTCAGEFPAATPYYYSSYESEDESDPTDRRKIVILGSGPNRIGQGIEFDYCCVQAVLALREAGFETIMVNSNPETVSTDFDVSDKLYFEPLTLEDVVEIVERERPVGVIVQLGGQTPLNLAYALAELGVPILGTSVDAIDRAEDRRRFEEVCRRIGARVPANGTAMSEGEALVIAREIGFPVLVRPSYVLGGRAMEIVYDEESLKGVLRAGGQGVAGPPGAGRPLPGGRLRGGCGRAVGRDRGGDRRDHAAHRGRGGALGRLGVRAAAVPAGPCRAGRNAAADAAVRAGAGCGGAAECAVRGEGRAGVCARGEPAGVADGAVRGEGDGGAAGEAGGAGDGGGEAGGSGRAVRAGGERGSRSRRRSSRSTGSMWIRCSDRRCGRRARQWAWTTPSGWRSRRRRCRRGTGCRRGGGRVVGDRDRERFR